MYLEPWGYLAALWSIALSGAADCPAEEPPSQRRASVASDANLIVSRPHLSYGMIYYSIGE